jgi:predicted O-methyltransferase YrrM
MRRASAGAYRRGAGPLGRRALDRVLAEGLPEVLALPLRVLLGEPAPAAAVSAARTIEKRRAEIARRPEAYRYSSRETPFGPARWIEEAVPEARGGGQASLRWLAMSASVPPRWGMFLHLCSGAIQARTVLELGAGVGISGAYLAATPSVDRLVTVEGSPPLARIAAASMETVTGAASITVGPFESSLPELLETLARDRASVDLAYVDGHHAEEATVHYAETFRPNLRRGSLVVLDDIRLWHGMWAAWRRLSSMRGVEAAVDTGRFGILVWDGSEQVSPRQFDLSRYTGWWRGASRRVRPAPGG